MSSNATPVVTGFRAAVSAIALVAGLAVTAQDDARATPDATLDATPVPAAEDALTKPEPAPAPAPELAPAPARERINLLVTVPRGEVNQAQTQQCEERADAGAISGEIVVCRQVADDGSNSLSSTRAEAQQRYAAQTAFQNAPRTPEAFGIPNHGNPIGFGSVPPPALIIDVAALPKAPAGSDADRIARGLPPLNEEVELTEEEEKARRKAAGIRTVPPPRTKKKGG